ncbi:Uncharacterized membrane protein [Syntrophus gentianae]|uniref:Uncharacterized membrane protein n=1 Tax=Syntrophus gentianae TaxID=43775 RepID=A0A1H7VPG9_9BACT|nr:EamA family transporter [Syntrophus gentianae]SEM11212.1 Uncharacterized membrane protein [Syntrophus gentianae]
MEAIGFAVLAALGFAWTNILTQLGMKDSRISSFTALFINLVGGTIVLLLSVPFLGGLPQGGMHWRGVLYFVAAGLVTALAGQAALLAAIHRIGATRTSCFVLVDNIFAVILGFLVLGQLVSLLSCIGILILMAGAAAFVWESAGSNKQIQMEPRGSRQTVIGIAMGVVAGLCFAGGGVLRGLGIALLPAAVVGAAINIMAGLIAIFVYYAVTGKLQEIVAVGWKRGIFLLLSGVANAVGTVGFILALKYGGTVAITTALKNTSPLLTFAFAIPLLRRHEQLSVRLGLLVVVVVMAAVLIALGRQQGFVK